MTALSRFSIQKYLCQKHPLYYQITRFDLRIQFEKMFIVPKLNIIKICHVCGPPHSVESHNFYTISFFRLKQNIKQWKCKLRRKLFSARRRKSQVNLKKRTQQKLPKAWMYPKKLLGLMKILTCSIFRPSKVNRCVPNQQSGNKSEIRKICLIK